MLWEGTWFESRLARSLFFSRVTYIVIVLLSNIVEWEKKYKTPVLSSSFFSILGDDVGKWRSEPNASVCFIKKKTRETNMASGWKEWAIRIERGMLLSEEKKHVHLSDRLNTLLISAGAQYIYRPSNADRKRCNRVLCYLQ
jgi:hypothetical protein